MPARAAEPMIDSIVIKFRDGALVDPAGGLTDDEQDALFDEIQTPFSHVGYTRDGALRLQLLTPLPLDAARAAVNRVRMLPQVLYANIVRAAPAASDAAAARETPRRRSRRSRRLIVKFRDAATRAPRSATRRSPTAQVDRLSALASQPVASRARDVGRRLSSCACSRRCPSIRPESLAAHMASDPDDRVRRTGSADAAACSCRTIRYTRVSGTT